MPENPAKSRALSIFLIKPELTNPQDILADHSKLIALRVPISGSRAGVLYVQASTPHSPAWLSFFDEVPAARKLGVRVASTAAVFLIQRKRRIFAVAFGFGRHLLIPGSYEENFGLRVTLNAINPERIRAIDRERFEGISRQTREQASRATGFTDFGLDIEQDLFRAVTGEPSDEGLGTRLTGRDALHATIKLNLSDLPAQLDAYLTRSQDETYRKRFPWADHMAEVRDATRKIELDALLLGHIRDGEHDRIWLAAPDIMDWSNVAGFRYSDAGGSPTHEDIHLRTYLAEKRPPAALTLEALRRDRITCVSTTGDVAIAKWPVYQCVYAELDVEDTTYLLSNGTWYRVEKSYVKRVNRDIKGIPTATVSLPEYNDATETDYNRRVATSDPARFTLLDRELIRYGGGASAIEFCDLYTADRTIIHIKRYGGSSVLSHLFAQGRVAATLFFTDAEFRQLLNEKLPATRRLADPAAPLDAKEYEIVFAIISRSATPATLPFFSKVNLRNTYRDLKAYGYRVSLANIRSRASS